MKIENIDQKISEIQSKLNDPKLCNCTAEIWTRVSGYARPVSNFNQGKEQEFKDRRSYKIAPQC